MRDAAEVLAVKLETTCATEECTKIVTALQYQPQILEAAAADYDADMRAGYQPLKGPLNDLYTDLRNTMIAAYKLLPPTATFPRDPTTYPETFWDISS
jgi:hypothetical protein